MSLAFSERPMCLFEKGIDSVQDVLLVAALTYNEIKRSRLLGEQQVKTFDTHLFPILQGAQERQQEVLYLQSQPCTACFFLRGLQVSRTVKA